MRTLGQWSGDRSGREGPPPKKNAGRLAAFFWDVGEYPPYCHVDRGALSD